MNEETGSMNLKRAFATFSIAAALCANVAQGQQISVYATGLEGPRGLKFGPDGALYVAEAGHGGPTSTAGACAQVVPPVGPYHGGKTARISRITGPGQRTTAVSGLPSAISSLPSGDTLGVADVASYHGSLYAVLTGRGLSHRNPHLPDPG